MEMASSKNVRKKRTPGDFLQFIALSIIAGVLTAGILVPPTVGIGVAATSSINWFKGLPEDMSEGPLSQPSTLLASDGKTELASFYSQNRKSVSLNDMSAHMQDAIISVEDRTFYEHGAVSPLGMFRAAINNFLRPGNRQGASTLTQQYVNNLLIDQAEVNGEEASTLGANKGYGDKIKEVKLAISMEQNKSKDEILEGYLNIVNLGGSNYGVEAASQYYWGISASQLNVQQAALLAGMVQSPNQYRPDKNPELAKERRNVVLSTMYRDGKITEDEYSKALNSELDLDLHYTASGCEAAGANAYFCNYVVAQVMQDESFGATQDDRLANLYRGGYSIKSTLNSDAQKDAKDAVESTQSSENNPDDVNASLVSVEPGSGKIVAMAQNTSYGEADETNTYSLYNYNVDAIDGGTGGFQIGSTFKPVVLAEWIKEGKGVNAVIDGTKLSYPASFGWKASCVEGGNVYYKDGGPFTFQNAESGYQTWNTVAYGLKNSINSFLYSMASKVDLCGVQDTANDLKIHTGVGEDTSVYDPQVLSGLIGSGNASPLTMASSFATFANEGTYCEPQAISEIKDRKGKSFKTFEASCSRALDKDVANGVNYVLKQVLVDGSAWKRGIDLPDASAAKTGTTDNSTQTWTVGYTRGLATASWVGSLNEGSRSLNGLSINGKSLDYVDGATYAGGQWQQFMQKQAKNYNKDKFEKPSEKILGTQS